MTLRGRLGSTRKTKRGLGCNTDSSTNSEGIIEGGNSFLSPSDLSPLPIFGCELRSGPHSAGQRSNTGATVWWTPWSGGLQGLSACVELKSTPHWSRNHRNPCAEKGSTTRSQQNKTCCASISRKSQIRDTSVGLWHDVPMRNKSDSSIGRGMLTITGSNMHRGIEMPVAATIFSRSRMGKRRADAHARGVAVAQRLHLNIFGGGECSLHNAAKATKVGGLM